MKNKLCFIGLGIAFNFCASTLLASTDHQLLRKGKTEILNQNVAGPNDEYVAHVVFPAGYQIGDYIEFVAVRPINAGSSGNYEISISYTRNGVAAAATHLASITHSSPNIWREVGKINSNGYHALGSEGHNFTVDCNTDYANPRFRLRAVKTMGQLTAALGIDIKILSINHNDSFTALSVTGNDLTVTKFLPMTNDWSLYVGNTSNTEGASVAIKATENGNVGIGTATPDSKLSVNGRIRAQEIKVEATNWPDYVFEKSYMLPTLDELERHIKEKGYLPGIPSAKEVKENGVELGEMNAKLLQKIEELTMYVIDLKKESLKQQLEIKKLKSNKREK